LATSLINHEKILTTLPKAKELRAVVDRLITYGKKGSLGHRRLAAQICYDKVSVKKIFDELAGRFKDRPGGYTRIIKRGPRLGDGAMMAFIEFVDRPEETLEPVAKST
jgi:large subunit ribosomal protein L17